MKLGRVLQNIGLTPNEAQTYLALLGVGEANLKEVADRAGLPRTSVYTPIKSLIKKGLVEFYVRGGRKYYVASSPKKLLALSKGGVEMIEENLDALNKISNQNETKPRIRFFEGVEGIKLIFNEILQEKRDFLAVTCIEDMEAIAAEPFREFITKRVGQNLKLRLLANRSSASELLKKKDAKDLRITRFLPKGYNFDTANYVFGDKVAILSLKQKPAVAVLIEDPAIAKTHRMYFDLIWNMASST